MVNQPTLSCSRFFCWSGSGTFSFVKHQQAARYSIFLQLSGAFLIILSALQQKRKEEFDERHTD